MPKVIGYTPPWLSRPSPGARIFSDPEPQSPLSPSKRSSYIQTSNAPSTAICGSRRIIAHRGSEIFTVVGNKIRWADLDRVKSTWELHVHDRKHEDAQEAYRTLVTPVYYQITELLISPSGVFLAICTEHTIHIAVLPDSSRLGENEYSPLKIKTYQLGPTTHVIPESPIATVLWHPLAASSSTADCLVSVTREAAVRMWEIDCANPWSFERPALAIDMRKLADGVSSDQDFEPSAFGKNRGFSADAFDMEVAAARFGGQAFSDEDGWASMTLWTAMSNGDIYALCPLLPTKWRPAPTTIPSLSISAVSKMSLLNAETTDADERWAAEQQYAWVQELDNEVPFVDEEHTDTRLRPQNLGAVPKLQGPFETDSMEELEDGEVTDIHVIAARLDEESLLSGEEEYEISDNGVQFTIVCLVSTTGQLSIALELDGVSGQWLPKKGQSTFSVPSSEARDLVLVDKITVGSAKSSNIWPMLSSDPRNPYSVFVTTSDDIQSVSVIEWAARVGSEIGGVDEEADSGLATRLAVACQNTICITHKVFTAETDGSTSTLPLSAPTLIEAPNIGQMLISSMNGEACAVLFDDQTVDQSILSLNRLDYTSPSRSMALFSGSTDQLLPDSVPTRAPYSPADIFYQNQIRPCEELRQKIPTSRRLLMTEKPLRLSPACLDVMTLAHRTFAVQTSNIEKAAAELFRRCERLREELADQVKQMSELADRLQHTKSVFGSDDGKQTLEQRLDTVQDRHKTIVQRYEVLRRKAGKIGTKNQELSTNEHVWIGEIQDLSRVFGTETEVDQDKTDSLSARYETVLSLAHDLLAQSAQISNTKDAATPGSGIQHSDSNVSQRTTLSLSSKMQRERIADVMAMVEREGAIIDAVMNRLSKLNVG